MSSNYAGSGTTVHTTVPMLDDGDRPTAQLWRQSLEPIVDSLAALGSGTGVGVTAIRTTGGTFTLTANVVIDGGAGPFEWRFNDTARLMSGASLAVASGATIDVASGGVVDVDGTLDVGGDSFVRDGVTWTHRTGSFLTIEDDCTVTLAGDMTVTSTGNIFLGNNSLLEVQSGGVMSLASGGLLIGAAGASIELAAQDDLVITAPGAPFSAHHTLTPIHAGSWEPFSGSNGIWVDSIADGTNEISFGLKLMPGDVLSSVTLRITGQVGVSAHAGLPATPVRVSVFSVSVSGVQTLIDQEDDGANLATFNTPHDITVNGGSFPHTVTGDRVIVVVRGEGGAGAEVDKTAILSLRVSGLALKFRNQVEFV